MMVDWLGYFAGSLVVLSLIPQIVKSWKTKSAGDLSLPRYVMYMIGVALWVTYGFLVDNGPIAYMNGVAFVLALCVVYLKIKYGLSASRSVPPNREERR
ncbi:MAG: MtN3/saliva-related transmembrane protein, conserved region [Candidatus Magasanikbacteria bacterium GW2011_GWA2_56_11]|uniref:MtN3/saliva-related transmembrane protein, conserved region n=1 Tax=Candidatus Magasanikbacteria bacterium GW2011_GWA2_56_11 TaxID=1619044 RepID=A0A0G1YGE9_9BACT|nr:MAG: MtN3/saliva-related transmembrane protein, conserved region [Candidatus Magasanikbacteria bacterium GW2011_GWA2_56_11]